MDEKLKEEVAKKRRDKWYDVWFAIEALAREKAVVEDALAKHVGKLAAAGNVLVYDKSFREAAHVDKPLRGVESGYSQVAEMKLLVRDLYTLLNIVMLYGPSAVEVLGPDKKELRIDEVQNIANQLAGIVHQFASAGVGGILISPGSK